MKQLLSFVIPSRNNLDYLKLAYKSIRQNSKEKHWICFGDDCSNDGTKQWLNQIKAKDDKVRYLINADKHRIGHTYLYDKIIDELVNTDIFVIWHADMYMLPGSDEEFLKHTKERTITSLTRIEPPLHPSGVEKVQMNFGINAKTFKEKYLLKFYDVLIKNVNKHKSTTNGIFAPWACYKTTFQNIGGHDWLFIPQSKEDSDIFNRFKLYGCEFVQTWLAYCYHFTSRGSRFQEQITSIGKNSDEWNKQNRKSTRNFIRKWGHFVQHSNYMHPIIPHKRDIGIIIEKSDLNHIGELEPYCNNILLEENKDAFIKGYLEVEQPRTLYNLKKKFEKEELDNDIIIRYKGDSIDDLKRTIYFLEKIDAFVHKETKDYGIFEVEKIKDETYENGIIYLNNEKQYNNKYSNLKIKVYK